MDIWVAHRIVAGAPAGLALQAGVRVHDLWPLSPIELGGMSPKHPFIRLCQAAETTLHRHADVVVSMLPKVYDHMQAHGLDLRKLYIVPNGIALEECRAIRRRCAKTWPAALRRKRPPGAR